MIMHLLKDGVPVLTARSEHTKNNSGHDFPITYEGDTSLLWMWKDMDSLSVGELEAIMERIALRHEMTLDGDFWNMPTEAGLVYVPLPVPNGDAED